MILYSPVQRQGCTPLLLANFKGQNVNSQPYPPALSQSWERVRLWRIFPRLAAENSVSRAACQGQAAERRCYAPLTGSPTHAKEPRGDGGYTSRAIL